MSFSVADLGKTSVFIFSPDSFIYHWNCTNIPQVYNFFYSYEFDEDDFEEEIMPIPKKRAALKNVQDEEVVVKPEPKKAKSEAKKAKPEAKKPALKNVQEEKEAEVAVKPEATKAKPPAKKKGRKK